MRTTIVIILLCLAAPAAAPAVTFDGPLQVRNQFPLYLGMNPPYLDPASIEDSFSTVLHYSSTYVTQENAFWTVNMDLELAELDLRFKKKLGPSTELGLDVPVIRPDEGFLDRPLESWHDIVGMGDYGRSQRPYNEFLYEIYCQGKPVILGVSDRTGLGDLRLTVKQQVLEGPAAVSVLVNAELPTGDARTGYGNGSWDFGAAVVTDFAMGERYRGYASAGIVVPGDLKAYQTIALRTYGYGAFGIEAAWWERFHVIVQVLASQSPFPETGIRELDWPTALLTFGGRYSFGTSTVEFSLTEDPTTASTPDFITTLAWRKRF